MRRLHVQIFLTLLVVVIVFGLLVSIAWWIGDDDEPERRAFAALQALIEEALPPSATPTSRLEDALARIGKRTDAYITVRRPDGGLLAAYGDPLPAIVPDRSKTGWAVGQHMTAGLLLSDGRQVIARPKVNEHRSHFHGFGFLAVIVSFVAALGIGAYPMARRLTRRLERLQERVDELGAGELTARVKVEGRDEVAALACSFNRAADRIQNLVKAQRETLAAASHELRSPLARLRMAFELLEQDGTSDQARQELRQRVERDINDLDALIEELLLVSRLDSAPTLQASDDVDLLGLAAEEAAHFDAVVTGSPCEIRGNRKLLRRLVRNLLENAERHGDGAAVEVHVEPGPSSAELHVTDRGPGVPTIERDRIFDPFFRAGGSAEDRAGGVGLGLHLVRQIARRHGGEALCLPSERGAHFKVTLKSPYTSGS